MVIVFLHPLPGCIPRSLLNLRVICAAGLLSSTFIPQIRKNLICYALSGLWMLMSTELLWRKSDQLFVCFGSPNKGSPVSKQRMSKWVVEAISLAYEAAGQPSPLAVRSHSTRSMAAFKAHISGVSLQDVCHAAGWSSPHTFVRFYSLDLDSTPGSHILSS